MTQPIQPLAPARLYRRASLDALEFASTAELAPLPGLIEQPRAQEAIRFGTAVAQRGFNIFAIGAPSSRIRQSVRALLDEAACQRPLPNDWIYVNNFATPHQPRALSMPSRRAPALAQAMHTLLEDLKVSLPAIFESEDYQKRRGAIEQSIQQKNEESFAALTQKAQARGIAILRTPMGFAMAPARDGKVVPPAEFNDWAEADQQKVRTDIEDLEKDLEETLRALPRHEKEQRDAVRALDRDTAQFAIAQAFEDLKTEFADLPQVVAHIEATRADILENLPLFLQAAAAAAEGGLAGMRMGGPFDRYEVNAFVTQADHCAPVVEELHPTLGDLLGRVEYLQMQGALVTNFRLIKAGALHRANGGIILIDARALLTEPFSWPALKRALMRGEIVIEDVSRFIGLATTVSLEPDPIPLDVKVVLFGDRSLYYLLSALDPDFAQHFKVLADFDDDTDRSPGNEAMLARLIGTIAAQEGLKPLDRDAVARVTEHAARIAEDAAKLTLLGEKLRDLIVEASHCAAGAQIARADVEQALEQQRRRVARVQERGREMILRDIALIETAGSRVGQVNGLSVLSLGDHSFGRPSRITCRVRPGGGKIVDIEREVELGGPLHSKGVLILSGFLAGRYALDTPMSLYASLVFEQSYGGVDGDSASSAELYALLSALSEIPLRQDLAVTGSVNQLGVVQAIGGVNEKIEGFFDICAARGLTGRQGVLIPAANAQHLMLRADVVEACAGGKFSVWPVTTIDEGIALLTGMAAGERSADGAWPEASVNRAVEERLKQFAKSRKEAGESVAGGDNT
ncbi:MAG TPA: ATP-binding protein [Acetobacteraceae bacterium]|nr:ATP-binding protein [Acetobacteraceae bacterium]